MFRLCKNVVVFIAVGSLVIMVYNVYWKCLLIIGKRHCGYFIIKHDTLVAIGLLI